MEPPVEKKSPNFAKGPLKTHVLRWEWSLSLEDLKDEWDEVGCSFMLCRIEADIFSQLFDLLIGLPPRIELEFGMVALAVIVSLMGMLVHVWS